MESASFVFLLLAAFRFAHTPLYYPMHTAVPFPPALSELWSDVCFLVSLKVVDVCLVSCSFCLGLISEKITLS